VNVRACVAGDGIATIADAARKPSTDAAYRSDGVWIVDVGVTDALFCVRTLAMRV
jgi:hypothetical protein